MVQKNQNLNIKKLIVDHNKTIKDALNNITKKWPWRMFFD